MTEFDGELESAAELVPLGGPAGSVDVNGRRKPWWRRRRNGESS